MKENIDDTESGTFAVKQRQIDPEVLKNLYEAGMKLRQFAEASTDKITYDHFKGTRAERLRNEADRIEAQDEAVLQFRQALRAAHHAFGKSSDGIDWQI